MSPAMPPSDTTLADLLGRAPKAVTVRLYNSTALLTCRDRSARITRGTDTWLVACTNAKGTGDPYPINDWAGVRHVLHWVAGPHVVDANGDVQELVVGTRLESGDPGAGDDYDRGEVKAIVGECFHVAWEGGGTVQVMTAAELDGLVIHEPAETIHWWYEWPASEDETAETEARARTMDERAWAEDRGC